MTDNSEYWLKQIAEDTRRIRLWVSVMCFLAILSFLGLIGRFV